MEAYALPHAPLQTSPSFASPSALTTLALPSASSALYITHLLSLSPSTLLALTSDAQVHVIDKGSLRVLNEAYRHGKGEGSLTSMARMRDESGIWGTTDRQGSCNVFDARAGGASRLGQMMSVATPTSSPLLSLTFSSSSSSSPLLALGHELQSIDAPVYVYDLRQTAAPLFTYDQSHSDDVTTLQFKEDDPQLLLSGSTDGLLTVYDLSLGADEDDAVLSAANTGSSVARSGWGGAASGVGVAKGSKKPDEDLGEGMDVDSRKDQTYRGLGAIWAVSDMQTVGMWDAESTDPLLPPLSALPATTTLPSSSAWPSYKWETDYIIDASPMASTSASGGLSLFTGSQTGSFALQAVPSPPPFPTHLDPTAMYDSDAHLEQVRFRPWTLTHFFPSLSDSATGGHEDIVRCIEQTDANTSTGIVWSGGEDGRVVAWSLRGEESTPGLGATATSAAMPAKVDAIKFEGVDVGNGHAAAGRRGTASPRHRPY